MCFGTPHNLLVCCLEQFIGMQMFTSVLSINLSDFLSFGQARAKHGRDLIGVARGVHSHKRRGY